MGETKYATFGRRLGAYLIDQPFIYAVYIISSFMLGIFLGLIGQTDFNPQSPAVVLLYNLAFVVLAYLYYAIQESSEAKATLGKKILGLQVLTEYEEKLSFAQASVRYVSKIISSLVFCLGYMAILWSDKRQGWHDTLASTIVVDTRVEKGEI